MAGSFFNVMLWLMPGSSLQLSPLSVKIVKGFTKTQCVLFTLLSCADVDLQSADAMDILKPLFHVLDKAWLIPVHVPWQDLPLQPFNE